jgi:pimeloyl-ACP methyl ester carboxylesterase
MMPDLTVILVHGTWGRGFFGQKPLAPWCRDDSVFVRTFKSALEARGIYATVLPLNWSGDNSVFERATAANGLKSLIDSAVSPGEPLLLVAHSHGGNVALQAIAKLNDLSNVHVCTLATPFFRLYETERQLPDTLLVLSFIFSLPLLPLFLAIPTYFLASVQIASRQLANLANFILINVIVAITVGAAYGLGFFLNSILINPYPKIRPPSLWQQKPALLSEATSANALVLGDRLLVLRGIDDEASLTLAVGAATNRLMRVAYALLMRRVLWGLIIAYVVFFFAGWSNSYLSNLVGATMFLAALALFLPGFVRTVFGRELAFGAFRCDAAYDSVPDSCRSLVKTFQNSADDNRLFHSLHQNPNVPQTIANWISEKVGATVKVIQNV